MWESCMFQANGGSRVHLNTKHEQIEYVHFRCGGPVHWSRPDSLSIDENSRSNPKQIPIAWWIDVTFSQAPNMLHGVLNQTRHQEKNTTHPTNYSLPLDRDTLIWQSSYVTTVYRLRVGPIMKEIAIISELIRIYWWNLLLQRLKIGIFLP